LCDKKLKILVYRVEVIPLFKPNITLLEITYEIETKIIMLNNGINFIQIGKNSPLTTLLEIPIEL